ncbi:hypothetical protein ABZT34_42055, partial [Streptomyces sp. NPDC005329]|uniref:hypothetical protein n=1 Tax=Streptomyces sp. NPDC005329 TaxID=3157034 RepID=UPI0033BF8861
MGGLEEVVDVIGRLLLGVRDGVVIQETAEALLGREDVIGMRCVLLVCSRVSADGAVDHLGAVRCGAVRCGAVRCGAVL